MIDAQTAVIFMKHHDAHQSKKAQNVSPATNSATEVQAVL